MLGAGAIVTYLKLRFQPVEELVKLSDKVVGTLSEGFHNLTGILVGICDLGAPRTTLSLTQGILSRSFSLSVGGGGLDKRVLALQAI